MTNASLKFLRDVDARSYGTYIASEAAFYIGVSPNTLRSWVRGRADANKGPVLGIADPEERKLSYYDVVSAHILTAFRKDYQISLQGIRKAIVELHKIFPDDPYPLLNKNFRTDGRDLFIHEASKLTNLSKYSQMMLAKIVEQHLDRITFDEHGLARLLYPLRRGWESEAHKRIVLDPYFASGRPIFDGAGVPVSIVWRRLRGGEDVRTLARDYGITEEDVQEAVQFHEKAA